LPIGLAYRLPLRLQTYAAAGKTSPSPFQAGNPPVWGEARGRGPWVQRPGVQQGAFRRSNWGEGFFP